MERKERIRDEIVGHGKRQGLEKPVHTDSTGKKEEPTEDFAKKYDDIYILARSLDVVWWVR